MRPLRTFAALGAIGLIASVAGCGGDSSGEATTGPQVAIPTVTSPLGTTATQQTSTGDAPKQQGKRTTTSAPASSSCDVPDTYQDFKFSGTDCATALGVATAWDQNGKACNTVDNPNSPDGYNRTCSVAGYSCTAKRDVRSDGRFVTCTQGGNSVRFTWFPA
jgi:hypothetical protein